MLQIIRHAREYALQHLEAPWRIVAKFGWKIVGGMVGSLTTTLTQRALNAGWTAVRHGEPPLNPEQRGVSWPEAISWALASAAGMAVTRVVSQRLAAGALGRRRPAHCRPASRTPRPRESPSADPRPPDG